MDHCQFFFCIYYTYYFLHSFSYLNYVSNVFRVSHLQGVWPSKEHCPCPVGIFLCHVQDLCAQSVSPGWRIQLLSWGSALCPGISNSALQWPSLFLKQNTKKRTSLVVQWIRILLPMQGTRVWFLVQEDTTCDRATKPVVCTATETRLL